MTRRISLNSVRVRLTLWNVGVLALGLVSLGLVFSLSIRARVDAAVDRRLSGHANHVQRMVADAPPQIVSALLAGQNLPPPGPPPDGFQRHPPGPPHDHSPEDRPPDDMRPRFFGPQGEPLTSQPPWSRDGVERALRGEEVFTTVRSGGDDVRVFTTPLRREGRIIAVAQWGNSLARFQEEEARTTRTLLTLIPLVLLIAGLGGAFLTNRALRPVRRIALAAGRIEAGNLSRRLPVPGNDEFADLAETFNGMLARLEGAFGRLEQAYEQQRRFTADASHELRTPLTVIKANTSLSLSGRRTTDQYRQTLEAVDAAADRMNRIIQDLLLLARSDAGQLASPRVPTLLSQVLAQATAALQGHEHAPVTLALSPPSLRVQGDGEVLARLFGNLLENAARHTPPDGHIRVSAEALGDVVLVKVADTGEGIPQEHLPHVTERFYRVDASRARAHGGTGLGLAICRSIAEASGGELTLESTPGHGTTVRVTLLRAEDDAVLAPSSPDPPSVQK